MDRAEALSKVQELIADVAGTETSDILESSSLVSFGLDEVDHTELMMQLEKEFDVTLSDEEVSTLQTVKQTVDVILKKL